MWQADRSADAPGRLENLKELVRSMDEFDTMVGFLEHVSLVMDADGEADADAVSIMTLHSAKGLEFDTVFLPGWEEGLFPSQRTLDENGARGAGGRAAARLRRHYAGAEARLHPLRRQPAHARALAVGHSRRASSTNCPRRTSTWWRKRRDYGGYGSAAYGASRFDPRDPFANTTYATPGWQRAQRKRGRDAASDSGEGKEDAAASTIRWRRARG